MPQSDLRRQAVVSADRPAHGRHAHAPALRQALWPFCRRENHQCRSRHRAGGHPDAARRRNRVIGRNAGDHVRYQRPRDRTAVVGRSHGRDGGHQRHGADARERDGRTAAVRRWRGDARKSRQRRLHPRPEPDHGRHDQRLELAGCLLRERQHRKQGRRRDGAGGAAQRLRLRRQARLCGLVGNRQRRCQAHDHGAARQRRNLGHELLRRQCQLHDAGLSGGIRRGHC